jgi:hypothetical protein
MKYLMRLSLYELIIEVAVGGDAAAALEEAQQAIIQLFSQIRYISRASLTLLASTPCRVWSFSSAFQTSS